MVEVLHINDNNLQLQNDQRIAVSQGYAWFKGDEVVFDLGNEKPVRACRLSPQEMNNRYWQQCEQSAIPTNASGMRHAADLVWKHLSALKQHFNLEQVVLVVPSHYREANLQLLLGVAKACGLDVVGLINKAVVALANTEVADGEYCHIDVQLHQTVCSNITIANGLAKLGDVDVLSDVGIHLMQEALLKGLQSNFIQNDRFDPLHDAATEQQLFDQLAGIANNIAKSGKASIALEHQSRLHNSVIDDKEWRALLSPFSNRLAAKSNAVDKCFIDLNAAFESVNLSALIEHGFGDLNSISSISTDSLIQADLSQGIVYKTDLPLAARVSSKVSLQINAQTSNTNLEPRLKTIDIAQATHILQSGKALPIERAEVQFSNGILSLVAGDNFNIQELLDNGRLIVLNDPGRTKLEPNDRLGSDLADGVVSAIQVF